VSDSVFDTTLEVDAAESMLATLRPITATRGSSPGLPEASSVGCPEGGCPEEVFPEAASPPWFEPPSLSGAR